MQRRIFAIVVLAWASLPAIPVQADPAPTAPPAEVKELISVLPPDVSVVVEVRNARDLRRIIGERRISTSAAKILGDEIIAGAWGELSKQLETESGSLFDNVFGQEAALGIRDSDGGSGWIVLTKIPPGEYLSLCAKLAPKLLSPGTMKVMEQNIVMSYLGGALVVGPRADEPLFVEVLDRIRSPQQPSLLENEQVAAGWSHDEADVHIYAKHRGLLGGASVVWATMQGDTVKISHHGVFDAPLAMSRSAKRSVDVQILSRFREHALMAMVEPVESNGDPFLAALIPELQMSSANLGERSLWVMGEQPGSVAPTPFSAMYPTFAFAVEINDADIGRREQDDLVTDAVLGVNDRWGKVGRFMLAVPDERSLLETGGRRIDVSSLVRALIGDHAVADAVSLNWKVVDAGNSAWQIYATSPEFLDEVAQAFRDAPPGPELASPRWTSAGFAAARRLGEHVQTWRDQLGVFFEPSDVESVRNYLDSIHDVAAGIEQVEWAINLPEANRMDTEIRIQLTSPDSAQEKSPTSDVAGE